MISLRNESGHEFVDISSEMVRTYVFPDFAFQVDHPAWLAVSSSGGHRILDEAGVCHYIPAGWRHLYWRVRDNLPHFVK